jgi:large subunit ribosomal protein L23
MDPYQIIQHPYVTEKTMNLLAENKLEFIVIRTANKPAIKEAAETLLEARVVQVRTYIDKVGKHAIVKLR